MHERIEASWQKVLTDEFSSAYFESLRTAVEKAYHEGTIFPPQEQLFAAFDYCPFSEVKVVILGQDPYHGPGQAHGLSFSVPAGQKIPPSLRNIYEELAADLATTPPKSGDLTSWAQQGVLLLNSSLTVLPGQPGSHQALGWEKFTDAVIATISEQKTHVVFILWGKQAETKTTLIDAKKHLVLTAPHPSPLSAHRGFFGTKPFSTANNYLQKHQQHPIKWCP